MTEPNRVTGHACVPALEEILDSCDPTQRCDYLRPPAGQKIRKVAHSPRSLPGFAAMEWRGRDSNPRYRFTPYTGLANRLCYSASGDEPTTCENPVNCVAVGVALLEQESPPCRCFFNRQRPKRRGNGGEPIELQSEPGHRGRLRPESYR